MKSILKNNLDDIPDDFKKYSFNLNKNKSSHINNINKKKEATNKIDLLACSNINLKSRSNNNLNSDFNFDLNSSSNKIIFLLILFLLNSCD